MGRFPRGQNPPTGPLAPPRSAETSIHEPLSGDVRQLVKQQRVLQRQQSLQPQPIRAAQPRASIGSIPHITKQFLALTPHQPTPAAHSSRPQNFLPKVCMQLNPKRAQSMHEGKNPSRRTTHEHHNPSRQRSPKPTHFPRFSPQNDPTPPHL